MSTSTLKDTISSTLTDVYVNHVSTHLSSWLTENKNIECSSEELCSAFGIPYTPRPVGFPQSTTMRTQTPNFPSYLSGTGATPKKSSGRRKKNTDPNAPRCQYVITRGKREGQECGEVAAGEGVNGGDRYCKNCLKKSKVKKELEDGSGSRAIVKPPVVGNLINPTEPEPVTERRLTAQPILGREGYAREENFGFVLKQTEDEWVVVGIQGDEESTERPLTEEEKNQAKTLGLSLLDTSVPVSVPQQVPVPVAQQPAQVPQIPI